MMNPVVRVLVQRASSARFQLTELIAVLSDETLERREASDAWSARTHAAHVLSSDDPLLELLTVQGVEAFADWLRTLGERREAAIAAAATEDIQSLVSRAAEVRHTLIPALAALTTTDLELTAAIPGMRSAWGDERNISLLDYLYAWSTHDPQHEQAIRRSILTRPDLSAVALTRRPLKR